MNGTGNITRYYKDFQNETEIPDPYTITFDPPAPGGRAKRYLLRLINTSFDSTFVFSIDNHYLEIVGADFVPIHPYCSKSVLVGIGQRYHVIVTANPEPDGYPLPDDGNYWIRTWKAKCFGFNPSNPHLGSNYEKTGILRYNDSSRADPTSNASKPDTTCSDEPYASLRPYLPWTVGPAANAPANPPPSEVGQNFTVQGQDESDIFPLAFFSMGGDDYNPLRIDYSDPTFLNLKYSGKWNPLFVIFPENYTDTDWVSSKLLEGNRCDKTSAILAIIPDLLEADYVIGLHGPQRLPIDGFWCTSGKY